MNTATHSATHEVWFACEFHGGVVPVFSKNTDVTYWEGVKFFHNKEDAIKHAYGLALQNMLLTFAMEFGRLLRSNL